jgi:hypothetical protein
VVGNVGQGRGGRNSILFYSESLSIRIAGAAGVWEGERRSDASRALDVQTLG